MSISVEKVTSIDHFGTSGEYFRFKKKLREIAFENEEKITSIQDLIKQVLNEDTTISR